MKNDYNKLIEDYLNWIKDNTSIEEVRGSVGNRVKIITPALDRHNDHIEFLIDHNDDKLTLSDEGYTISDLSFSGMEFNSPKRKKLLQEVLNGFGVKLGNKNELYVEASPQSFGQKKHYLLQAMLAVNDLSVLSEESVFSFFREDVEAFFKRNEIVFTMDIKMVGKSGMDQNIDFLISRSINKPERLIKTINTPQKSNVLAAVFALHDVSQIRKEKVSNYVIYNDIENKVSEDLLEAFTNYDINPVPWSKKEEHLEDFVLA